MSFLQEEYAPVPFVPEQVAWIRAEIAKAAFTPTVVVVDYSSKGVPITPVDPLPAPPQTCALQVPITEAMIGAGIGAYGDEWDEDGGNGRKLVIAVFRAMCAASIAVLIEAKT